MTRSTQVKRRWGMISLAAMLLATLAFAASACGGDDDGGSTSGGASTSGGGSGGEKVELTFSTHVQEASELGDFWNWYMDEITRRTDGQVSWKTFWTETLVRADEILPALNDGRADVGQVAPAYYPAELPLNTASEVPFTTDNVPAAASAWTDLGLEDGPLKDQWERAGALPLGVYIAPPPVLGSKKEIKTLADLKGLRVRTIGRLTPTYAAVGANPIASIQTNEVYESLERGLLDAYTGFHMALIPSLKLSEVAPYALDTGAGIYAAVAAGVSKKTWDGLPENVRDAFLAVAREVPGKSVEILERYERITCEDTTFRLSVFPPAEVEKWKAAVGSSVMDSWIADTDKSGSDAQAFWDDYMGKLDSYTEEFSDYVPGMVSCVEGDG